MDKQIDRMIKTTPSGATVFYTSPFWGKGYVIPNAEKSTSIRKELKSFRIKAYIVSAISIVACFFVGDESIFTYAALAIAVIFIIYRKVFLNKLTQGLTISSEKYPR
jgi:hypothetical protein